ncbi:MAG: Dihydroneopterin aldolase [Pelotomaculum sp. PtaU1.Bin035]|nr:MAG: Dihydroneopterin aldolase [Pelotomaculum sp. PtaU1.Bin035]
MSGDKERMQVDKIILEGMECYGYHGVSPQEQALGQRFTVDVELFLDLSPAGKSDGPDHTVDYARVFDLVGKIVGGRPYKLIESVAEAIASEILRLFPVKEVMIRVKKPQAPLPGRFSWVAAEIRRKNE